MSHKKGKNKRKRLKWEDRLEQQAENRRKLLNSLSPETAEMTRRYFAKMGLFQ